MYELVKKIIDRGTKDNVEIRVAFEKIATEEGRSLELVNAYEFYHKYYFPISALYNLKRTDDIKKMCEFGEAGKEEDLVAFLQKLKDEEVIQ